MAALESTDVATFSSAQVPCSHRPGCAIETTDIGQPSTAAVRALSTAAVNALGTDQIAALTPLGSGR